MIFDKEQRGIALWSLAAIAVTAAVIVAGYLWLPPELVGTGDAMTLADRIAFALKWNLPVFLWLAGCVQAVARGRFYSSADRPGAAYAPPSPALAVPAAVLQNSLEQTVLAFGATLILATVLRGPELVLIPLLVLLYVAGRIAFAVRYANGAVARAFGMALTGGPLIIGYGTAVALIITGR